MDRSNLPLIAPQYEPRYISAKDVLTLLGHGHVPGVNEADPRVQEIRSCVLGNVGRISLTEALKAGYVFDRGYELQDAREALLIAWKWWCTAAGHPHIVLGPDDAGLYRVRCDVISAGKKWCTADVLVYPRILGEVTSLLSCDFAVDARVLEVSGVEMDDAISIARALVEYTTTGAFRQRESSPLPPPDPAGILMKPLLPMERSDGG